MLLAVSPPASCNSCLNAVNEWLFISNAHSACCPDLLDAAGITLLINVSRLQPFPPGPAPGQGQGQRVCIRVPVFDEPSESLGPHLTPCADAIEEERVRGGRTLVYCKHGRSRSVAVVTAYLMRHGDLSLRAAFQKVKSVRPAASPNEGFWRQLLQYEAQLMCGTEPVAVQSTSGGTRGTLASL